MVCSQTRIILNFLVPSSDVAEANMLYLETPVGVGFSYSNDTSTMTVDDEITGFNLYILPVFLC